MLYIGVEDINNKKRSNIYFPMIFPLSTLIYSQNDSRRMMDPDRFLGYVF